MKIKHFIQIGKIFKHVVAVLFCTLVSTIALDAAPLWYPIQPIPQGGSLLSVDCSTYECSAVGATGSNLSIRPGTNGLMAAGTPYGTAYLYANAYGEPGGTPEFLAITSGTNLDNYAYALKSTNGYSWAPSGGQIAINSDPHTITDVIWTGAQYVAVGHTIRRSFIFSWPIFSVTYSSTPIIATSSDGVAWTTRVSSPTYTTSRGINAVASNLNGTIVVAVGGGIGLADIRTSTNGGITWSTHASPVAERLNGITWDGVQFVAVGDNGAIVTSPFGVTWTDRSPTSTIVLNSVTATPNLLIAVGNGIALSSSDSGVTWASGLGVADNLRDVIWDGTEILAVGDGGAVLVSYDGFLWFAWDYAEPSAPTYYDTAYNGTNTVAVGTLGTLDLSTDNGVSWSKKGNDPGESFQSVDWVPNLNAFFAVGYNGLIKKSTNGGISWTNVTSPTTASFYGVSDLYSNTGIPTMIAAVGAKVIYTSPDGVSWTAQTDPYSTYYKYGVAGSDTKGFVAVGQNNLIEHSANQGVTWTARASPVANATWYDVHYYSRFGVFIAVGTDGTKGLLIFSNDGLSWTDLTYALGSQAPNSAFYGVGGLTEVIAVGSEGTVFTSVGGSAWTQTNMPTSAILRGVAETTAGHAVSVGGGSTIIARLTDTQPPQQIVAPLGLEIEAVNATPILVTDARIEAWLKQFYATDDRDYIIFNIQNNAPASFSPNTTTPISFSVTDKGGNTIASPVVRSITTVDQTPPVVTPPSGINLASTGGVLGVTNSNPGIISFLAAATATDNVDGAIGVVSNDAPAILPIGSTVVTFSASDSASPTPNTGTATATVTVWDAQAPTINIPTPAHYTIAATGPSDVAFSDPYVQDYITAATAYDNWDSGLLDVYSNTPVFPVGTQVFIDFYATDSYGNIGRNAPSSASITVLDINAPVITPPSNITIPSTNGLGVHFAEAAVVSFATAATAIDNVDLTVAPVDIYSDITTFISIGTTTVTFFTDDVAGNRGTAQANITVWDAQAPSVYLPSPADLVLSADTAAGLSLTDPYVQQYITAVVALDDYEGQIATVTNNAPSNLPMNATTTIQFSAVDTYGNVGTSSGTITVIDISAPTITAPADISVLATSALGTDIGNALIQTFLTSATVTDNVDTSITIFNDAPSVFPIGQTKVNFIADDTSGNRSVVTATVEVTSGTGGTVEPSSCLTGTSSLFGMLPFMGVFLLGLAGFRRKSKS